MIDFSIFIGGQAGEGIKRGSFIIGKIFNEFGYYVFIYEDYGSIIRGGQDYTEIRVKDSPALSQYGKFDYMFAFHKDVFDRYKDKAKEDSVICIEQDTLSFDEIIKEFKASPFMKTSIVIGILSYMLEIPKDHIERVLEKELKHNAQINIELVQAGFDFASRSNFPKKKLDKGDKQPFPLLFGNEAIALGAVKAGMKVYTAYPITPTSTLLEYLAKNAKDLGIAVIHTEDEIASILMAIGASYAGAPAMTGSSGPGIDLMGEAISLAGATEIPLVVLDVMRAGPSTGVPTYTEQSDLNLILNIGHGEFPRIVLAIGSIEEAFEIVGKAFQYAWWYQTPVFVISDKHISESAMTALIPFSQNYPLPVKFFQMEGTYKRYEFSEDGISEIAFPGTEGVVVHVNSTEHTEDGYSSSIASNVKKMKEKRLKKRETIFNDFLLENTINVFGNPQSKNIILGFGSTKGAILEAISGVDAKYIQIIVLEPFPKERILKEIPERSNIICVENNSTGQLSELFENKTLLKVNKRILKYDARPFDPWELREHIKEAI